MNTHPSAATLRELEQQLSAPDVSYQDKALSVALLAHIPATYSLRQRCLDELSVRNLHSLSFFETVLLFLARYLHDPALLKGDDMAWLAALLLTYEAKVGGPYLDENKTCDLGVNGAIWRLFKTFGAPLPALEAYVKEALSQNILTSRYLSSTEIIWLLDSPLLHKVSINSKPKATSPVVRLVLSCAQEYAAAQKNTPKPQLFLPAQKVKKELHILPGRLNEEAQTVWRAVNAINTTGEVTQLATAFSQALVAPARMPRAWCDKLGMANFYTWMSYSIYDDFIDDEARPVRLPVANIAQRKALFYYEGVAKKSKLNVKSYFDKMDSANFWELTNCRFVVKDDAIMVGILPSYKQSTTLYQRSVAHVLGPLIIARHVGSPMQFRNTQLGLFHYLAARQLNDDIHDWADDFKKGHISFVVAYLLKQVSVREGSYSIAATTEKMQQYFWESGMEEISKVIAKHCQKSRTFFAKAQLLKPNNSFLNLTIGPIEASVQQSLAVHTDQKQFLTAYENKTTKP